MSSVVKTAIGTTNGTTGYTVGVSGTPAQFMTVAGTAIGSGSVTNNSNIASSGGFGFYDSATAVLLTATGGNFDGTGIADVTIIYEVVQQSNYIY